MKKLEHYKTSPIPIEEQNETISVAVAVYNSDAYLERALDSLCRQTYRNLEIILVDDGSTDNSGKICDYYAREDSRIKVVHKENGGLFTTRNVGIENATGTYITFLDGDDWIDENMYESMLSALKEHEADLAVCRYRCVYQDGIKDLSTDNAYVMEGQEILEKHLEDDEAYLIQNAAWNKLYRRSLIMDLRFPSRWYEDMLYTIKLLSRPVKSVYLDQAYYNYICDRSASIMNQGVNNKIFSDQIPNMYDRSIFLREIGREDLALLQDYNLYKRLLLIYTMIVRSKDPEKKAHKKYMKEKLREGRSNYKKIFSIPYANPNEYRKLKIFLLSPGLYRVSMWLNDTFVIPYKLKRLKK